MKIPSAIFSRHRHQGGSVVLILLILLVIMTLLAAANSSALLELRHEVGLLEHRQVERLNAAQENATTNAISTAQPESK